MVNKKNLAAVITAGALMAGCNSVTFSSLTIPVQEGVKIYTLDKDYKTLNEVSFKDTKEGKISYSIKSVPLEFSGQSLMYVHNLPKKIKETLGVENLYNSLDSKFNTMDPLCNSDCGPLENNLIGGPYEQSELETLYSFIEKESKRIPKFSRGEGDGGNGGASSSSAGGSTGGASGGGTSS